MHEGLLELLRCPFCGSRLSVVEGRALVRDGSEVTHGVLGCACCAYPVVDGIPVLVADDATREAMHALEEGRSESALLSLLGLAQAPARAAELRRLLSGSVEPTYEAAVRILSPDAEGTYFLYRFSDPTYVLSEAVLRAVAEAGWPVNGRVLDLCGGSGHLARALTGLAPRVAGEPPHVFVADLAFWKLWLARRFTSPQCAVVCCDANEPLPFDRAAFSLVVLSDAYPYIWRKRLLAEEMMRVAGPDGAIVMAHLHSALGENFTAGDPLVPEAYRELLAPHHPRLFSDARLLDEVLDAGVVDLSHPTAPTDLAGEPSLTIVACRREDLFGRRVLPTALDVRGELRVNPLYRVETRDGTSKLTLAFPSPEYAEEFADARRYLPSETNLPCEAGGPIEPEALGQAYEELRRRRVVLDLPLCYC
jgi:uncharacterized protein YbaR (Trm112 family)/SAM-dependent methyltransferase